MSERSTRSNWSSTRSAGWNHRATEGFKPRWGRSVLELLLSAVRAIRHRLWRVVVGEVDAPALARIVPALARLLHRRRDRKSTRLNSSHPSISYAVFCLKKKKKTKQKNKNNT